MAYRMYRITRPYNAEAFLHLHYRAANDVNPYNAEAFLHLHYRAGNDVKFSICIIGPEITSIWFTE